MPIPHSDYARSPLKPPRRLTLVALLLAAALTSCGGSGASTTDSTSGNGSGSGGGGSVATVTPGQWVVMGSSTAAGVGATTGNAWPERMAAALLSRQVTLRNLARAGAVTPQALPAAAPAPAPRPAPDPTMNIDLALSGQPTLILLSFPTNDVVAGYPAQETVANLRSLRLTAAAAGSAAVLLGVQPRSGLTAEQRSSQAEVDRQLAIDAGPCFLPLYDALADPANPSEIAPAYAAGDGIHLNDAGHARIWALLQALLAQGQCVRLGSATP
jgi:lysophospholipase L1-like esterase